MAVTIDTLRLAKRLKDAKVPDEQAELLADIFRETQESGTAQLATKQDLERVEQGLRREIDRVEQSLRREIAEAKFDLIKWTVPVLVALVLAVVGLYFK